MTTSRTSSTSVGAWHRDEFARPHHFELVQHEARLHDELYRLEETTWSCQDFAQVPVVRLQLKTSGVDGSSRVVVTHF